MARRPANRSGDDVGSDDDPSEVLLSILSFRTSHDLIHSSLAGCPVSVAAWVRAERTAKKPDAAGGGRAAVLLSPRASLVEKKSYPPSARRPPRLLSGATCSPRTCSKRHRPRGPGRSACRPEHRSQPEVLRIHICLPGTPPNHHNFHHAEKDKTATRILLRPPTPTGSGNCKTQPRVLRRPASAVVRFAALKHSATVLSRISIVR